MYTANYKKRRESTRTAPARFFGPERFCKPNLKKGEEFKGRGFEARDGIYTFDKYNHEGYLLFKYSRLDKKHKRYAVCTVVMLTAVTASCSLFRYEKGGK